MSKVKSDECKGCSVYTNPHSLCNYDSYHIGCPCKICLLKMLCNNVCEDFDIYSRLNAKKRAKECANES